MARSIAIAPASDALATAPHQLRHFAPMRKPSFATMPECHNAPPRYEHMRQDQTTTDSGIHTLAPSNTAGAHPASIGDMAAGNALNLGFTDAPLPGADSGVFLDHECSSDAQFGKHSARQETGNEPAVFEVLRFLNQGSFGTVHVAREVRTDALVAVKEMRRTKQNASAIQREVEISQLLRHPYIIRTYHVVDTPAAVYLVQEFAARGDLFDYIENSGVAGGDEDQVKLWFLQVVSALTYMHEVAGVVHRDVKPENIVIHANMLDVRLLDFGLARYSSPETREPIRGRAGTDPYMAEEVFAMGERDYIDGRAADVWSLGITLFAMLIGQFPWQVASRDHEPYDQYRTRHALTQLRHGAGLYCGAVFTADPFRLGFTRYVCDLLDRMLSPVASDRIAIRDIATYCDLPWYAPAHPLYEPLYPTSTPCPDTETSAAAADIFTSENNTGLAMVDTHHTMVTPVHETDARTATVKRERPASELLDSDIFEERDTAPTVAYDRAQVVKTEEPQQQWQLMPGDSGVAMAAGMWMAGGIDGMDIGPSSSSLVSKATIGQSEAAIPSIRLLNASLMSAMQHDSNTSAGNSDQGTSPYYYGVDAHTKTEVPAEWDMWDTTANAMDVFSCMHHTLASERADDRGALVEAKREDADRQPVTDPMAMQADYVSRISGAHAYTPRWPIAAEPHDVIDAHVTELCAQPEESSFRPVRMDTQRYPHLTTTSEGFATHTRGTDAVPPEYAMQRQEAAVSNTATHIPAAQYADPYHVRTSSPPAANQMSPSVSTWLPSAPLDFRQQCRPELEQQGVSHDTPGHHYYGDTSAVLPLPPSRDHDGAASTLAPNPVSPSPATTWPPYAPLDFRQQKRHEQEQEQQQQHHQGTAEHQYYSYFGDTDAAPLPVPPNRADVQASPQHFNTAARRGGFAGVIRTPSPTPLLPDDDMGTSCQQQAAVFHHSDFPRSVQASSHLQAAAQCSLHHPDSGYVSASSSPQSTPLSLTSARWALAGNDAISRDCKPLLANPVAPAWVPQPTGWLGPHDSSAMWVNAELMQLRRDSGVFL